MTDWNYLMEDKVVADWNSKDADAVCALAQECWTCVSGPPRASCSDRIDAGVPRKRSENTETAFLAKRRRHVMEHACLLPVDVVRQLNTVLDADAQTSVDAELDFQQTKHMRNQVEAYLDGSLLASEVPDNLREVAQAFQQKELANAAARHKQEAKLLRCMTPQAAGLDWAGAKVHLANEAWKNSSGFPRALTLVARPCYATCFVQADAAAPQEEVLWYAALGGGHIVSLDYVISRGRKGVCFSYGPAVLTKRQIFIDPDVATSDPALTDALRQAAGGRGSKWKLLRSWEDFARATDTAAGLHLPVKQRREKEVLALTTDAKALALNRGNVCTKNSFLPIVWRVACTSRGLCGT